MTQPEIRAVQPDAAQDALDAETNAKIEAGLAELRWAGLLLKSLSLGAIVYCSGAVIWALGEFAAGRLSPYWRFIAP